MPSNKTARTWLTVSLFRVTKQPLTPFDVDQSTLSLSNPRVCSSWNTYKGLKEPEMLRIVYTVPCIPQVLRQLTAETKQKRYDAEDREASLRARLVALERRAEASERDCRHQKLSTWRTITRETERAAARERCLSRDFQSSTTAHGLYGPRSPKMSWSRLQ